MKTSIFTRSISALTALLAVCLFSMTVFAEAETGQAETVSEESALSEKAPKPENEGSGKDSRRRGNREKADRFEDWFEDRIEARKNDVDFSELPDDPTDEEMIGFFKKYFLNTGSAEAETGKGGKRSDDGKPLDKPEKKGHGKDSGRSENKEKANRFEDWFEERIETRKNDVDFSKLPDDPTDEEMMEFFKKYILNAGSTEAETGKGGKRSDDGKPLDKPEKKGHGKDSGRSENKEKADRFEDWFEDRIEAREHDVDFSKLPDDPTDEEMIEFFRKYYSNTGSTETETGKGGKRSDDGKPLDKPGKEEPGKDSRRSENREKADRFEDWFEDRIEAREHDVDFSKLPDDPSDEEMIEFFREHFMEKSPAENSSHKDAPNKPASEPEDETVKDAA